MSREPPQNSWSARLRPWQTKFHAPGKERAQLLWVAHMNELKAQAEEMVVREVVYAE